MIAIIPERLALLDTIKLDPGAHPTFEAGHCVNEVAAWLAGEPHSDSPRCVSPVLRSYTMRLNDRLDDERRQQLKPYVARLVGTAGDGQDEARMAIAQAALVVDLLPPWLRLAGLDGHADELVGLKHAPSATVRSAVRRAADAAWEKRAESRRRIEVKVRELLAGEPAAVAAAAAAAAADAVAAAAADAVAAAAAAAAADPWGAGYAAAKAFWRKWFAESDHPQAVRIRDLAEAQRDAAFTILEQMIDPSQVAR